MVPHSVPPICAPFMSATRCTGEDGDRQSMISRRYGVRAVRQRPGSEERLRLPRGIKNSEKMAETRD
jgi:hypothetical protein